MPQIKEYTSRVEAPGAVDVRRPTPEDFGAAIGRGMAQFGQSVQNAQEVLYKRAEQEEVSDLQARMAELQSKKVVELQNKVRDGSLNADEFHQELDNSIGELSDNVSTDAGARYMRVNSATLRAHFLEAVSNGSAVVAGVKAKNNYITTLNTQSSTLLTDPSSYNMIDEMHAQGIDEMVNTGQISAEDALKLKASGQTELAKSAVRGWIKLNPDLAKKELESGRWDEKFDGDVKNQLFGEADQALRARDIDAERARREQERILKEKQQATQNDFLKKMEAGDLTSKDILESNLDAFGSGSKEQFLQLMKTSAEQKIRTEPKVMMDLWDRIHLPDGDPKKIVDENELNQYLGRGLTFDNIIQLRGEIAGKKTAEGEIESELKRNLTETAKNQLTKSNPMLGIKDPIGDEQYQRFLTQMLKEYSEKRKSGKSYRELLDPDSPDYLGKTIRNFVRTPQQIIKDQAKMFKTTNSTLNTPPKERDPEQERKPGESAADYLKRTGK